MVESAFVLRRLAGTSIVGLQGVAGRATALMSRAPQSLEVALNEGPHRVAGQNVDSLGIGPLRWLLVRYLPHEHWAATLEQTLAGDAAVTDQSDAYVVFEASGTEVRTALARGVAVDLHPSTMTPHDVAVTRVGHINVVIWLRAPLNAPRFYLAVGRSYADSFEHFWRADEK